MADAFAASTCVIEDVCKIGRLPMPCVITSPPNPEFNIDFRDVEIPPPPPVFPQIPYIGDCNIEVDNCKGTVRHLAPCEPVCAIEVYSPAPGGGVKVARIGVDRSGHMAPEAIDCPPVDSDYSSFWDTEFESSEPSEYLSEYFSEYDPDPSLPSSYYESIDPNEYSSFYESEYDEPPDPDSNYSSYFSNGDCETGLYCVYVWEVAFSCETGLPGEVGWRSECIDPTTVTTPNVWVNEGLNLAETECIWSYTIPTDVCCSTPGFCTEPPEPNPPLPDNGNSCCPAYSSVYSEYSSSPEFPPVSSYFSSSFEATEEECPEGMVGLDVTTCVQCEGNGTITVLTTRICTIVKGAINYCET